jgi:Sulfotransferase family
VDVPFIQEQLSMNSHKCIDVVTSGQFCERTTIDDQKITPEITILLDGQELYKTDFAHYQGDDALKSHFASSDSLEATQSGQNACDKVTAKDVVGQTVVKSTNNPCYLTVKMSDFEVDFEPLIFVHLPKTAGTSFRYAMELTLGAERTLKDYGLESPDTSALIRESIYSDHKELLASQIVQQRIKFLTGHFNASRYLLILDAQVRWCTFVRHPVQRLISEYNHFVRHHAYKKSLEEFCYEPFARNRQSQLLYGLEPNDFFFIGITELYEESIAKFNRLTGLNIPCLQENVFRAQLTKQYQIDNRLLEIITENNLDDFKLYEHVRAGSFGAKS